MTEWIDVVDRSDRTLRRECRDLVHARGLLHRAVSVWIAAPSNTLWIQQRSEHKRHEPGLYSPTASGHVDAGESYAAAASRELMEEAGFSTPLRHLDTLPACEETGWEFTAIFVGSTEQQPNPCKHEVARMDCMTLNALEHEVHSQPRLFSSSFRTVYRWLHHQQQLPIYSPCR